mmetsp:Transcript_23178/g.45194  ORF Transcript_23178/g.45194 Transcript_23178/m.45194 type:complete len:452 (+) Transcript_23178:102-1457(+)
MERPRRHQTIRRTRRRNRNQREPHGGNANRGGPQAAAAAAAASDDGSVEDALWDTCYGILLAAIVIGWLSDLSTSSSSYAISTIPLVNKMQRNYHNEHEYQYQQQWHATPFWSDDDFKMLREELGIVSSSSSSSTTSSSCNMRDCRPKMGKLNPRIIKSWTEELKRMDLTIAYPSVVTFARRGQSPSLSSFDSDIVWSNLYKMDIKQFISGCTTTESLNLGLSLDVPKDIVETLKPNLTQLFFLDRAGYSSRPLPPSPNIHVRLIALQPQVRGGNRLLTHDRPDDDVASDDESDDESSSVERITTRRAASVPRRRRRRKRSSSSSSSPLSSSFSQFDTLPCMLTETREGGRAFILHLKGNALVRLWQSRSNSIDHNVAAHQANGHPYPSREFHLNQKNGMRRVLHIPPFWDFNVSNMDKKCTYLLHVSSTPACRENGGAANAVDDLGDVST